MTCFAEGSPGIRLSLTPAVLVRSCCAPGKLAEAQDDINRCLQQGLSPGACSLPAACVLARAAVEPPSVDQRGSSPRTQAITLLASAFQQGYGRDGAETDPDLLSSRHRPELQELLHGKRTEWTRLLSVEASLPCLAASAARQRRAAKRKRTLKEGS